jgi:hypothetical protein
MPTRFPTIATKYCLLVVQAVTMIFWLAGFIALAVYLTKLGCKNSACQAAAAGDVFAGFELYVIVIGGK